MDTVRIVPFDAHQHFNFVIDGILNSNRVGFDGRHSLTKDYYAFREPYWRQLLFLPDTWCVVATNKDIEDQFVGFALGMAHGLGRTKHGILHYVYVKQPFREFGVAKKLVQSMPWTIRFYSTLPSGWKWRKAKEYDWKYEPHAVLAKLYGRDNELRNES